MRANDIESVKPLIDKVDEAKETLLTAYKDLTVDGPLKDPRNSENLRYFLAGMVDFLMEETDGYDQESVYKIVVLITEAFHRALQEINPDDGNFIGFQLAAELLVRIKSIQTDKKTAASVSHTIDELRAIFFHEL